MRREDNLMRESFSTVFNQVARKDEKLASVLNGVIENVIGKLERIGDRGNFNSQAKSVIKVAIKKSRYSGNINQYPGEVKGRCREICVGLAFNQWGSKSKKDPGFEMVANWINNYWHKCKDINNSTIIITTAWDQDQFQKYFKNTFDSYTVHNDKTVAVVLLSPYSLSLQYLR